jgi:hypothetical protein
MESRKYPPLDYKGTKNFGMRICIIFLSLILSHFTFSQEISKYVVSSAGGHLHAVAGIDLHWTLGEIAASDLRNDQVKLTQGYQQIYLNTVPVFDWATGREVNIFPNPTSNYLSIKHETHQPLEVEIRDLLGRTLRKFLIESNVQDIYIGDLPDQTLLLLIYSDQMRKGYKVIKTSG